MDVRDNIRICLAERGFNNSEIARLSGMSPQTFCAMVHKRRKLEANEMIAICNAMRIAPEDLLNNYNGR